MPDPQQPKLEKKPKKDEPQQKQEKPQPQKSQGQEQKAAPAPPKQSSGTISPCLPFNLHGLLGLAGLSKVLQSAVSLCHLPCDMHKGQSPC